MSVLWEAVNIFPSFEEWQSALEKRHGVKLQKRICEARVAVCGLGGLGSNIAVHLARAGVGKLILADFDRVDITNLNRQQYKANQVGMFKTDAMKANLYEISPYTDVVINTAKITQENIAEIVGSADIICEAFDSAEAKAMLVNFVLEHYPEKYLIAASGMAGLGSANEIKTRKISNRFYLCGDEKSDSDHGMGLVSTRVAVCAAHQAHTVLRILANESD